MIDQKRENLLNLALAATEVERRRVPELSAGYNSYSKTWEVIVQYQGDLAFLEEQGVRVTLLLFSYAILLVPESLMDYVTGLPQITYLEKPKLLYFAPQIFRFRHPEHAGQFFPVRADLFKKIRQFFKKCSVIFHCPVISPQGAVENSRFYQILEHMASVAELRHISCPAVGHFADPPESGYLGKAHRHAQFRRGSSYSSRRHQ